MKYIILLLLSLRSFPARQFWSGDPAFPSHKLERRRFGQESIPASLFNLPDCPGAVCGILGGGSIKPLLAMQPPCSQQDYADTVIDAALNKTNGIESEETRKKLIEVAIQYRQAEKNSKPIYWPTATGRNSLYCDKPPRHSQLQGLVQKQDPANDPKLFFDPSKINTNDGTVLLGSQPNTFPFGQKSGINTAASNNLTSAASNNLTSLSQENPAIVTNVTGSDGNFTVSTVQSTSSANQTTSSTLNDVEDCDSESDSDSESESSQTTL